ncbi:MAG: polysaccharide deacetylase family protein, partial [Candidatus Peregrinibacteria bacterium]
MKNNRSSTLLLCGMAGMSAVLFPLFSYAQTEPPERTITLPILMYHYVESLEGATKRSAALITSPVIFEKQLLALQERSYKTIFVSEIPGRLVSPLRSSPAIALTFDDGYEDFYANVLPLLKKYRAKATLYVVTEFIGKRGYLTQEEMKEIAASGLVSIGAHTLHHLNLPRLSS